MVLEYPVFPEYGHNLKGRSHMSPQNITLQADLLFNRLSLISFQYVGPVSGEHVNWRNRDDSGKSEIQTL